MRKLNSSDQTFAIRRLPAYLRAFLLSDYARDNRVIVCGGYLRSVISGEPVTDIDVFTRAGAAQAVADKILKAHAARPTREREIREDCVWKYETPNAITLVGTKPVVQIIHRWSYDTLEECLESFDYTICCAGIALWEGLGLCAPTFYEDLAAKRLVYRAPDRDEAPGGSVLRLLKFYQRGYRIPIEEFSKLLGRFVGEVGGNTTEERVASVMEHLYAVDPQPDESRDASLWGAEAT